MTLIYVLEGKFVTGLNVTYNCGKEIKKLALLLDAVCSDNVCFQQRLNYIIKNWIIG